MENLTLTQIALLLAAAAVAAPFAKLLKIGPVLGYIGAGVLIGPYGLGQLAGLGIGDRYSVAEVRAVAEFGIALLLFLIGLELRLPRLWTMRSGIFGAGAMQVLVTGLALGLIVQVMGLSLVPALFVGLALSLSSTAITLQVLEEGGELGQRHGRLAFSVLLFQDLAALPLIALAGVLAVAQGAAPGDPFDTWAILKAIAGVAGVLLVGKFAVDPFFRFVARSRIKDAFTASALLVVVLVVLIMNSVGLSAPLGAFLAGVVLADSTFRHQIEADIRPFEGLFLGLFFTAIGMTLDVLLILAEPVFLTALTIGLVAVKALVMWGVARQFGFSGSPARRLAFSISQGGEFTFVLLGAGVAAQLLLPQHAAFVAVVATLSMVLTPLLMSAEAYFSQRFTPPKQPAYELPPQNEAHVIIAGYGRMGQIVARVLRARNIPFTALDTDPQQIETVKRFGATAYFGDAGRIDILEAADAGSALAFVLAIDDVEASLRTARLVRERYPKLPIFARARNRRHVHQLMDIGVSAIHRETFASALELTADVLKGLGESPERIGATLRIFRNSDEKRLKSDYEHFTDEQKLAERARAATEELELLLDQDAAQQAISEGLASPMRAPATDRKDTSGGAS